MLVCINSSDKSLLRDNSQLKLEGGYYCSSSLFLLARLLCHYWSNDVYYYTAFDLKKLVTVCRI